jgi:hypothetical protein
MGSVVRIFTSAAQSQTDPLILGGFWASIGLNATVVSMIYYYHQYQAQMIA